MQRFNGHGKLLITAEYFVLRGAKALAVPCKFGQNLTVTKNSESVLLWNSFTQDKKIWFSAKFELLDLTCVSSNNIGFSNRLQSLLQTARSLQPEFLKTGTIVDTHLEFDRSWGLGSSSTLLYTLSKWAGINPYMLLEKSFGGSGYDIACAGAIGPICYHTIEGVPHIAPVDFNPPFKDALFFVHLNRKQNSQDAVADFKQKEITPQMISKINGLTEAVLHCQDQKRFNALLQEHENLLSQILEKETVQKRLFSDFDGSIKSLGAWGGDFVLASGDTLTPEYFKQKGYPTVIPYKAMIL